MLTLIAKNSLAGLYILQATTYSAAALCSRREDHEALSYCYLASALVHTLFGACPVMHFG